MSKGRLVSIRGLFVCTYSVCACSKSNQDESSSCRGCFLKEENPASMTRKRRWCHFRHGSRPRSQHRDMHETTKGFNLFFLDPVESSLWTFPGLYYSLPLCAIVNLRHVSSIPLPRLRRWWHSLSRMMKVVLESGAAASPSSSSSFLRRNARAVLIRKIGGGGCRRRAEGSPPPPPRPHPEKWFSILGIGGAYASAVSYYVLPVAAVGLYHVVQEETCRSVGGRA